MGIVADWVESWKEGWKELFKGNIFNNTFLEDDWKFITDAIAKAANEAILDPLIELPADIADAAGFLLNAEEETKESVASLGSSLFDGWTRLLRNAFAQLNVDAPIGPEAAIADIAASIQAELALGDQEATKRLAVVVGLINLVVLTGSAASTAAELLSAGHVRSLSDAIQSWVWANGLGGMTSLAYSPQINASVGPWLDRKFNERAQAKLPGPGDLVRFQLREVFLEDRRGELVGTEDREVFDLYMKQLGFNKFWADSFWGAHWVLPSISQLNEMLFRGVIDQEEWTRFVRFNDFEPSQIPNLQKIIFNPYTRVDVRRMSRMGILDDSELLQAYADLGNFAPTAVDETGRLRAQFVPVPDFTVHKAQALVIFTKIFNALPELRARFRNNWITADELLAELTATGIPPDKAQKLWETIVKAEGQERTAPERNLTRGLIARAWKLRLISFGQGVFLLERIGWSMPEAELILRVQSEADQPGDTLGTILGARLTGGAIPGFGPDIFEGEEQ